MFKKAVLAFVTVLVPALIFGCVRDVKTESAASFNLESGQTWAWVPGDVATWQEYKKGAESARVHTNDAYVAEREQNREMREERREEPVGPERRAERREDSEVIYDGEAGETTAAGQAGPDARTLKREHKHIQESIEGELSDKGIEHVEGGTPTYYVAYYLFAGGKPVAATDYEAYESRTGEWADHAEDTLVIDIVDPATGKLMWTGSGEGNTRGGGNEDDRMRGVKEAVRHIMRDL